MTAMFQESRQPINDVNRIMMPRPIINQAINQSILNWTSESPAVEVVHSNQVCILKNFKRCGEGA